MIRRRPDRQRRCYTCDLVYEPVEAEMLCAECAARWAAPVVKPTARSTPVTATTNTYALCTAYSMYGDRCDRQLGHVGNHRGGTGIDGFAWP